MAWHARNHSNGVSIFCLAALLLLLLPGSGTAYASGPNNLALNVEGSGFPEASASYTCGCDSPWSTLNGIHSYTDSPRDRWTNYGSPNASDWVAVDFGGLRTFNQVKLYVFDDGGGVRPPASYDVQIWNGSAWVALDGLIRTPSVPAAALNTVDFDTVTTSKLRVVFANGAAYSGIVELEVYMNQPESFTNVSVISAFGDAEGQQISLQLAAALDSQQELDPASFSLTLSGDAQVAATNASYDSDDPEGRTILLTFSAPVLADQEWAGLSVQSGAIRLASDALNNELDGVKVTTFHLLDRTEDQTFAIDDIVRVIGEPDQPDINGDAGFDSADIALLLEHIEPALLGEGTD